MDGSLYDEDFYTWTRRQAAALRALSARAPSSEVDWANLVDEVEDLGKNVARVLTPKLDRDWRLARRRAAAKLHDDPARLPDRLAAAERSSPSRRGGHR